MGTRIAKEKEITDIFLMKKNILPIIFIIIVILTGYYKIFFGADFFTHQDPTLVSNYAFGNSIGNGWRPDKGFGISLFFGDPIWHPWSFFSLWTRLFSNAELAYSISIVLISLSGGISTYFLLRIVIPSAGKWVCLLCPLIIFAPHMSGNHYLRLGIGTVVTPLSILILYKYYKHQKIDYIYLLYFALILWVAFVFGSILVLSSTLSISFFFSLTYMFYHKEKIKEAIVRLGAIYILGVSIFFLLAFWIFYTSFVELSITEYMRVKNPHSITWDLNLLIPDINRIFTFLVSFIQVDWLPHDVGVDRSPIVKGFMHWSYNVTAMFPLVLVFFLFRRPKSFWEYSFKILVLLFLVHTLLSSLPLYSRLIGPIISNSKNLIDMYSHPYVCQIGLIAIFLFTTTKKDLIANKKRVRVIQKGIASILLILYSGLALFTILSILLPQVTPALISWCIKMFVSGFGPYQKDYIAAAVYDSVSYMQTGFHWYSFVFYSINAVFVLLFIKVEWLLKIIKKPVFVAFFLLVNAVLMAWTVYPVNTSPLAWEMVEPELPEFEPYDRFYYAEEDYLKIPKTLKYYKEKVSKLKSGAEYMKAKYGIYGYEISPALNLHGHRSFAPKNETDYILRAFNYDGIERLNAIRGLAKGPLISSELLDMGAVNYYYTRQELFNIPDYLSLYYKASNGLSIYKNLNAWPYFFLAEHIGVMEEGKHLKNVKSGTAYLAEEDLFQLPENTNSSSVKLKEFSYGKMIFDFHGDNEELLVVADPWHPFWKARIDDNSLPIIKVNEIFKGVRLPKGEYTLIMFFDTSPYFAGVYVSIIAWIVFISGWAFLFYRQNRNNEENNSLKVIVTI